MKIFCPYCGIKGIAKDSFYNKKVNCPGCKKHFTIECGVIAGPHQKPTKLSQHPDSPRSEKKPMGVQASETTKELKVPNNPPRKKTKTTTKNKPYLQRKTEQVCSSCGASIKKGAEYTLGNGIYCPDCTPMPVKR